MTYWTVSLDLGPQGQRVHVLVMAPSRELAEEAAVRIAAAWSDGAHVAHAEPLRISAPIPHTEPV